MSFKSFISKIYRLIVYRNVKFNIKNDGLYILKNKQLYLWEEIIIINGYLDWIATSDLIRIEIIFGDGKKLIIDDVHSNINYLMDKVLANNLINFNINWFVEVTTLGNSKEPFVIYRR